MYRFALRPRWVVLHVLVAIAVPSFVVAGFWQLRRLDERRTRNTLIREREQQAPRSLEDVLNEDDPSHRRVRIKGWYVTGDEVVLIGRPGTGGIDGSHVLTPLHGKTYAVLVDRGWVPPGMESPPLPDAAPPEGKLTVTGILLPTEGRAALAPSAQHQEVVDRIDVARVASGSRHPFLTTKYYIALEEQRPPGGDLPKVVDPPSLGEGPHLGYAIQWFLFVPTLVAVYIALLRQQVKRARHPTD